MVKGVHLLLGEAADFSFSFAIDVFCKVSHCVRFYMYFTYNLDLLQYLHCT